MGKYKGFTSVELTKPGRSTFDLSHENRLTTVMGRLTPIFIQETLPDDTFRCNSEVMLRLAPLLAPIFHRVNVFVHYFFVPNRLLWNEWEDFITNGQLGNYPANPQPVPPNALISSIQGLASDYLIGSTLADYLGVGHIDDTDVYTGTSIDLMPFAAYHKVFMDYYRDRNYYEDDLAPELPLPSGAISDADSLHTLMQVKIRGWERDFFTSALPWTQRGDEVLLPLQGTGTVTYLAQSDVFLSGGAAATGAVAGDAGLLEVAGAPGRVENIDEVNIVNSEVSINDLRNAVALQKWLERNALAGSRYSESIRAHFGKKTSDGRLQRAEYLGGGKVAVKISEVVTTAFSEDEAAETVPPASMTGHGISFGNSNRFSYNCEEHGFVIGIMSVMPTSAYMQGTKRMFLARNSFTDYAWPTFAHLGEMEVKKYELFTSPANMTPVRTDQPRFGYQSQYADWKHASSETHGDFKTSLDFWHVTRKFASSPTLGGTFVTFDQDLSDRIFAVSDVDTLWCYIFNQCTVKRSLPYYGTPRL